jgi:hypothetical protein
MFLFCAMLGLGDAEAADYQGRLDPKAVRELKREAKDGPVVRSERRDVEVAPGAYLSQTVEYTFERAPWGYKIAEETAFGDERRLQATVYLDRNFAPLAYFDGEIECRPGEMTADCHAQAFMYTLHCLDLFGVDVQLREKR